MRLSFAIMLLVAAATQISAAVTPNAEVSKCTAGSSGLGKGDGYKGYCCKTEADCIDDCVKGVCVGPVNTKTTTPATKTTTTPTTPTPGTCTPGSSGLGNGDGYKGACCKTQADCIDDCVKGACVGPVNTKTTTPATKTTTTPTTPTPGTCTPGSSGLGKGDGYKGACCKTQADCIDDCVKGACVGPVNTKTTTPATKTTTTPTTPTPGTCTPGSSGLGKGDGYKGACCKTQADCIDDCVKGACVGPVNTKTTSATPVPTTTPAPGTCTPGSSGKGNGDGKLNACCKTSDDCLNSCISGKCNAP
ncbi:unnamed protein product [Mucor hiemalis]